MPFWRCRPDLNWCITVLHHQIPFVAALTKADKLKKSEYEKVTAYFADECFPFGCKDVVLTSASTGLGIERLQNLLESAVEEVRG